MSTANPIKKQSWLSPQVTAFTAAQVKGAAPLLNNSEFLSIGKTDQTKNVMHVVTRYKPAPRISLIRFAFYCVLMVLMLPLFLFTGRTATR